MPFLSNHCAVMVPLPPPVMTIERPRLSTPAPKTGPPDASGCGPHLTPKACPPPLNITTSWWRVGVVVAASDERSPASRTPPAGSPALAKFFANQTASPSQLPEVSQRPIRIVG